VIHHAVKGSQAATGAIEGVAGGEAERAEELSSRTVFGRATRSEGGGEVSIVAERRDGAAAG